MLRHTELTQGLAVMGFSSPFHDLAARMHGFRVFSYWGTQSGVDDSMIKSHPGIVDW